MNIEEQKIEVEQILSVGGELGALMRRINWSNTALGDEKDWPENLKACIRILFNSIKENEKILTSEKHLEAMIEHSTEMISLVDSEGDVIYCGPTIERFLGFSPEELKGKKGFEFIHPADLQKSYEVFQYLIDHPGESAYLQQRMLHKNGNWIWCEGTVTNHLNTPGIHGILSNFRDIHTEYNTFEELKRSEEELRGLFYNSHDSFILLDRDSKILALNNLAQKGSLLHIGKKMEIGHSLTEYYPAGHEKSIRQTISTVFDGQTINYETSIPRLDNGQEEWYKTGWSPVCDDEGKVISVCLGASNITEQKKAELQLQRSKETIEKNEKLFRSIVSSIPNSLVCLIDKDYRFRLLQGDVLDSLQIQRKDFTGLHLTDVFPAENVKQSMPFYERAFHGEQLTLERTRSDRHYIVHYIPLKNDEEIVENVLTISLDITEIKNAQKKIEESEMRYRQLVHGLPVAMYTCNTEGYIDLYNEAAVKLWGRTPEIEKDLWNGAWKIFRTDGTPLPREEFPTAVAITKGKIIHMEIIIERPDGTRRYVTPHPQPVYDANGKVTGAVNMLIDITEQKQSQKTLEENEIRLRLATEGTKLATWDLDLKTRNIIYAPRLAEIFGHHKSKILTHSDMRNQLHPDDREAIVEKAFAHAMETGFYDYEARVIRPDKTVVWIKTQGKVIFNEQHEPMRMLGTMGEITDIKEAELKLGKLASIVQSSRDAIISKTLQGIITSWNEGAVKMFGYTAEEMIGQHISKLFPPERIMEEVEILNQIRKGEVVNHFETQRLTKNNVLIDISLTISPIKDSQGKIIGASKIARDISDQKKGIKVLEEAEHRQTLALASAEMGAWDVEIKSGEVVRNLRHDLIFGYNSYQPHWNYKIFLEHVFIEDKHILKEAITFGKKHGSFKCELRIIRPDNALRWIKIQARIVYDDKKEPMRLLGTVLDITEQKTESERLERKVEERTKELVKQKEFVDAILDSTVDIIAVFNKDLRYISLNKKAYEIYEVEPHEVIGKHILEVFPSTQHSGMYDDLVRALNGKTIHNPKYKSPVLKRHFENFFIPLKHGDGEIYGVLMIGHENTAIIEATEKLKATNLVLEEKNIALERSNKELESFSYVASHDLQEPLRKIQTFADMLKTNRGTEEQSKNYLEKIKSSSQRMSDLIKAVLNYSRLTKTEDVFEEVDLNIIVEEIKSDFELLIREKKAKIKYKKLPVISGIPLQLSQLFSNLINNSIKFSSEAPQIEITSRILSTEEVKAIPELNFTQKYIELKFTDNGIGFEQQYANKIFAIFQRLHEKQAYMGTGIGLALCKKIVENHHGVITAKGELGKGAVFTVYLPKL
ncbi:MAG: sensor signal transduction histidine kinase [Bacteroidota bacterium]|nr:sensor signal transduction histidine kinase [Bacteroidota bacterium]